MSRARRHDPHRRDRLIDTCLDVIAVHGVAGTSHRRVAAAADVPLGSMTYHFASMDELLRAAFERFAASVGARIEQRLASATTPTEAAEAVVSHMGTDLLDDQRELVLTTELYALAARDPRYRDLTHAWMSASRVALGRHFDPDTARILDAVVEGLTLHRALDTEPQDPAVAVEAVRRVIAPS